MLPSLTNRPTLVARFLITAAFLMQRINAINIQPGDTLSRIAAEQGISVAALEAANPGISVNNLQPGQVVKVPASNAPTSAPTTLVTSTSTKPSPSSAPPSTTPPATTSTPATPTTFTADIHHIGMPSCAPSPIGKYKDADDVVAKTYKFCNNVGHNTLDTIGKDPYDGVLDGSDQSSNSDKGRGGLSSNESGYNMTIKAVPGCVYPPDSKVQFTVGQPMGTDSSSDWYCTSVLTNCFNECNNKGMGGQLQAGCFLYTFEPDP